MAKKVYFGEILVKFWNLIDHEMGLRFKMLEFCFWLTLLVAPRLFISILTWRVWDGCVTSLPTARSASLPVPHML